MPSTAHLLAFAAASLILILIPGPSNLFVVGRALTYGRRKAVLTAVGNSLGEFAAAALVAVGLGTLVQQSALVFNVVKYAGAAYLVYLGVKAFRERGRLLGGLEPERPDAVPVFEGFLVGVLNPKTVLFFLAMLPQFVDPAAGSPVTQMLVLGAVFSLIACACDSLAGLAASTARGWFESPKARRAFGAAGGVSMIGLGVAAAAGERA
ncbi:LysE family translocator [Glycomyces tenuis]|uniref:LysE family translocator n=1 Tax=Glycomyces tenuis TaxID=58116 RepID=UPI0003FE3471|nr:LysE family translocator [Glycomyces tenuis]